MSNFWNVSTRPKLYKYIRYTDHYNPKDLKSHLIVLFIDKHTGITLQVGKSHRRKFDSSNTLYDCNDRNYWEPLGINEEFSIKISKGDLV